MSRTVPTEVVPPLRPWQRALYAGVACLGGLAMVVAGVAQLVALARALQAMPPVIEVQTGMPALILMGFGITGFGLLACLSPEPTRSRRVGRGLDRGQRVTAVALGCLLLLPVCTIALRLGTASRLEAANYQQQPGDERVHSRFLSVRWIKAARPNHFVQAGT